jgi:hypothetical protein
MTKYEDENQALQDEIDRLKTALENNVNESKFLKINLK